MKFSIMDYLFSGMSLVFLGLGLFFVSFFIIHGIIRPRKGKIESQLVLMLPFIALAFTLVATITLPFHLNRWAQVLDVNDRAVGCGYVEEITDAGWFPVYFDIRDRTFSTPSNVMIDGTRHYILSAKNLKAGEYIQYTYCTYNHAILQWEYVPEGTVVDQPDEEPGTADPGIRDPQTVDTERESTRLFPVVMVAIVIWVAWQKSRKQDVRRWSKAPRAIEGMVLPRKVNLSECSLEFGICAEAVASLLFRQYGFFFFFAFTALLFWGLRFCIMKTQVFYEEDWFIHQTLFSCRKYNASDVTRMEFVRMKGGGRCLILYTAEGGRINLEETHYCGVDEFAAWLAAQNRK